MKANEVFRIYSQNNIPLADIKTVFDGFFHIPFDSLGINGDLEIDSDLEEDILNKLLKGYPAVYLVGYDDIRGNRVFLNENVLIPRMETIEFIYDFLVMNYDLSNKKILDLCTGSGFIAMALKREFLSASLTGSDISKKALEMAKKSIKYNKLDIRLLQSDFLSDIDEKFDVIISNPPYIEEDSKDVFAPFEPELALFSGKEGIDSYLSIFRDLEKHLNIKGLAFFELESTNSKRVTDLFKSFYPTGYKTEIYKDFELKDRYLLIERED